MNKKIVIIAGGLVAAGMIFLGVIRFSTGEPSVSNPAQTDNADAEVFYRKADEVLKSQIALQKVYIEKFNNVKNVEDFRKLMDSFGAEMNNKAEIMKKMAEQGNGIDVSSPPESVRGTIELMQKTNEEFQAAVEGAQRRFFSNTGN